MASFSEVATPSASIESEFLEQQVTENMASLSSSASEERERKMFMQDLSKFMVEIGKPLSKIPIMGYKELDLFQLFKEVAAYGGFNEVVKNVGTWSKIWKRLANFDPSITDSSFRLKKNYERYLLEYEYKVLPEHRQQASDMEKRTLVKSSSFTSEGPAGAELASSGSLSPTFRPKNDKLQKKNKKKISASAGTQIAMKEIARESDGTPRLPLLLGELTIEALGTILPRAPYVTEKHIWPIGFTSSRYFHSMNNPSQRVKYTSKIVDGGDKPQFVVTAEDDPSNPIISHSPSVAWRIVLRKVMAKEGSSDASRNVSVSGKLRFGLAHPAVVSLIRELPGAEEAVAKSQGELSPSMRKRKNATGGDSSSESEELEPLEAISSPKLARRSLAMSTDDETFESQEEIDLLESAVATLSALKFSVLF